MLTSWSSGETGTPSRTILILENMLEWMGSPEGELDGEVRDVVWMLLEKADVDARKRKIIWDDGQRLSITEAAQRIHADCPNFPLELIGAHVI